MPTIVQFRRGSSTQLSAFTGAEGEFVYDTTLKTIRLQDGSTSGGIELLRKDFSNAVTSVTTVTNVATTLDTWSTSTYRSAKYTIQVTDNTNSQYQISEVNVVHNGTDVFINETGVNYTGASARISYTATISAGTLSFKGTGVSSNNTVQFIRFIIPV